MRPLPGASRFSSALLDDHAQQADRIGLLDVHLLLTPFALSCDSTQGGGSGDRGSIGLPRGYPVNPSVAFNYKYE